MYHKRDPWDARDFLVGMIFCGSVLALAILSAMILDAAVR
jgi:hypothetical protein